jgi:hypothetical protein
LLPLDLLAVPGTYLPITEQYKNIVPHNVTQSDLILGIEPVRKALNSELRAAGFLCGRLTCLPARRPSGSRFHRHGCWRISLLRR